jgi:long-subunit acyl-CoA synthetase (AMP-forming)
MYTQEQVDELKSKLKALQITEDRLKGLQSMAWLKIDFGYEGGKCWDLPINSSTTKKICELLLAEYASRVKTLQNEIENTIIINPSKL